MLQTMYKCLFLTQRCQTPVLESYIIAGFSLKTKQSHYKLLIKILCWRRLLAKLCRTTTLQDSGLTYDGLLKLYNSENSQGHIYNLHLRH